MFSFGLSSVSNAQCASILAYSGTDASGSQAYTERLGVEFTASRSFVVNALGAYDSDQDGLNLPITVRIVRNSDGVTVVGDEILSGISDPLSGFFRVRTVAPVTLPAGTYTIVAEGYGASEHNGNLLLGDSGFTNPSGGILTFVQSRYGGNGPGLPGTTFANPSAFHAGNFQYYHLGPVLSTSINGVESTTTTNDSNTENISFVVCNEEDNIVFDLFEDTALPNYSFVKVKQIIETNNVSVPYCVDCSALPTVFTNYTSTATLINPAMPGTLIMKFFAYIDGNNNNLYDAFECKSDSIIYTVTVNPIPTFGFTATVNGDGPQIVDNINGPDTIYLDFCAGESFAFSGYSSTPSSQVRFLEAIPSGTSNVTYNNVAITVPRAQQNLSSTIFTGGPFGPYGLTGGFAGNLTQNFVPYYDSNNNNLYDEDIDCLGDTITIIYNVIAKPDAGADQTACRLGGTNMAAVGLGIWSEQVGNPGTSTIINPFSPTTAITGFSNAGTYNYIWSFNGCSDTTSIVVSNTQIVCPANISIDILTPLSCDTLVNLAAPIISGCIGSTIVGPIIDGTLNQGATSAILAASEDHIIIYRLLDPNGFLLDTCKQLIIVNDYVNPSLGCKNVQLSLDEDCEGELDPTAVLTGWEGPNGAVLLGCLDFYTINVKGKSNEDLGNTLDKDQLGKTLKYTITHPNGFTCWGDVTIEDKIAPTITCRDVTVNCLADLTKLGIPIVDDNCSAQPMLVNETHENYVCDDEFVGKVTKTWKAVDAAGNESGVCSSTIYLKRPSSVGIVPPAVNVKLSCSQKYAKDTKGLGFPAPSETGFPTFDGKPLYPVTQLNMIYCNATIDYTDVLVIDSDCKKRIMRSWSITEWWCSTAVSLFAGVQVIDIVDEIAPMIPQVKNITVTTQTRSCNAAVSLPTLNITDNCNLVYNVYINAKDSITGEATGYLHANGGIMELVVGTHAIEYTAFDNCRNSSIMTYYVTVKDETDPVAICDQFATVSIKTNGYTDVTAKAIDDGSFDECGEVTLKVRRMEDPCSFGHDTAWYDKVAFCCLDANTSRMVQLLVTDKGGNTNMCMVIVNVQEKVNPTITCPADRTINDCTYTFDPANADDYFGAAVIIDNCPANNTLRHTLVDNRNQCGIGTVVRTFSVLNGGITYQTCTQTITFENNEPFYINDDDHEDLNDDILWPKDYLAIGQCSFGGLSPEMLPDSSSMPKFTEDACDLVGMRHEDLVFPFTTNGACYKIIRTWTVIDWCQKDEFGDAKTWSHEQEIKVMDNDRPILILPATPLLFETLNCTSDEITLSASAIDCTPSNELRWHYKIFENGYMITRGDSNVVTDEFEVGTYSITFTVEDRCGNLTEGSYDFSVDTKKTPTAVCKRGLASPLTLMDVNGTPTPMTMLSPSFFDNKSSHPCGYTIQLSFSSDVNDTLAIFGCASTGEQVIELWVTDQNGNTSFCETFVDVQPNGLCPTPPMTIATISGRTATERNEVIEDVIIDLEGVELNSMNTDVNGKYAFQPMPSGGHYQIIPKKDGDDMNGVSTLDIVMIQRHILGVEKLTSPYQILAADANNSGTVTASDLTELRKLILGMIPALSNNTSWRFIDAGFKFSNPVNPWETSFPEVYNVDKLTTNMDINFIGVKVGDVNGNAKGHKITDKSTESRSTVQLAIDDRRVIKGEVLEIPVMVNHSSKIFGLQGQWKTKGLIINNISKGAVNFSKDEILVSNGNEALMSISAPNGIELKNNQTLFVLKVEVLESGQLSQMLFLGDDVLSEIYIQNLETKTMDIAWRGQTYSNFEVSTLTPNPWNTSANIQFELPKDGMVAFKVRDMNGKNVISTIDHFIAGQNTIQLTRSDIGSSGIYIYELRFGDQLVTGKMILIE